jgi:lambda family phage portal protein
MQAKVAALFAGFISDMDGQAAALGDVDPNDEELETIEPGQLNYLKPGQEVTFPNPPSNADLGSFSASTLRGIAAGLGVTYEDISGDYSQVNFSSARMARLSHYNAVNKWRDELLINLLCKGVWRWVMQLAAGMNEWPSVPRSAWTAQPMPMISPEKEGRAIQTQIRAGLKTLPEGIRELGKDPATHIAEIAESNAALDAAGIILDSDPRNTSSSGGLQDAGEDPGEGSEASE